MPTEIEAKFLDIDIDNYRKLLKSKGCKRVFELRLFRRTAFILCDSNVKGYCRVRDEGDTVTMTVKTYPTPKYAEENEITINETFEDGVKFYKSLGLIQKAYQESYREKWSHPLANEITIDIIPGLPAYSEIETGSEEDLNKIIDILELDKSKMRFGSFDITFNEYYDIDTNTINFTTPFLTFKNVINEIKPNKNFELLKTIYNKYKHLGKVNTNNNNLKRNTIAKKILKKTSKKTFKKTSKKNSKKPIKKTSKKTSKKISKKPIKKTPKKIIKD
jgi:hypothetical protein